jgi:glycosyltransferase involved in cell wall biosynthesis
LYVGRFAPEKNLLRLLQSYVIYKQNGGSWDLRFIGHGPLASQITHLATINRFSAFIHLEGYKEFPELIDHFFDASVLILPSLSEPWGLVVNEAMAAGCPILASRNCGCVPDLVTSGINGWIFDPLSEAEMADAMQVASNTSDQRLDQMSEQSLIRIAKHHPRTFALGVKSLCDQMLKPLGRL